MYTHLSVFNIYTYTQINRFKWPHTHTHTHAHRHVLYTFTYRLIIINNQTYHSFPSLTLTRSHIHIYRCINECKKLRTHTQTHTDTHTHTHTQTHTEKIVLIYARVRPPVYLWGLCRDHCNHKQKRERAIIIFITKWARIWRPAGTVSDWGGLLLAAWWLASGFLGASHPPCPLPMAYLQVPLVIKNSSRQWRDARWNAGKGFGLDMILILVFTEAVLWLGLALCEEQVGGGRSGGKGHATVCKRSCWSSDTWLTLKPRFIGQLRVSSPCSSFLGFVCDLCLDMLMEVAVKYTAVGVF